MIILDLVDHGKWRQLFVDVCKPTIEQDLNLSMYLKSAIVKKSSAPYDIGLRGPMEAFFRNKIDESSEIQISQKYQFF